MSNYYTVIHTRAIILITKAKCMSHMKEGKRYYSLTIGSSIHTH